MVHSEGAIGVSHFFETLKSQRRLDLITEVNTRVAASMPSQEDSQIEDLEDLSKVDVYAGEWTEGVRPSFHDSRRESTPPPQQQRAPLAA